MPLRGWYADAPTPGEIGPAVLVAHVDWKGAKGVFYSLRDLKVGDDIIVERADKLTIAFKVRRVEQYAKDKFPTTEVYGNVSTAQLRLITCGGTFDHQNHSYRNNIAVFAEMVSSRGT